jgi:integrase
MRGRTEKRGNTWTFVVDLPPVSTDVQKGRVLEPDRQCVEDFLAEWLKNQATSLSPATVSLYRRAITTWINPRIGRTRLVDLTPARIQSLYTELSQDPTLGARTAGKAERAGLGTRAMSLVHSILNRSLDQAVDFDLIARNPAAAKTITKPRKDKKPSVHWTLEESRTFLDETAASRHWPMWSLFLSTGLRRGEVLGLLWEDVDLEAGVLNVTRAIVVVDGKASVSAPKTTSSRRSLYLSDAALTALKCQKVQQAEDRLKAGTAWEDSGLVFTTPLGGLMHPQNLRRVFETAQKQAGMRRIRPHDMRHTFASMCMEKGIHPKLVQEMLGHTSANLSLDLYTHTTPGAHRVAINVVGDALKAKPA